MCERAARKRPSAGRRSVCGAVRRDPGPRRRNGDSSTNLERHLLDHPRVERKVIGRDELDLDDMDARSHVVQLVGEPQVHRDDRASSEMCRCPWSGTTLVVVAATISASWSITFTGTSALWNTCPSCGERSSFPVLLGLDRTAAEDAASDPLARTTRQRRARRQRPAARPGDTTWTSDMRSRPRLRKPHERRAGLVSEPSLGLVVIDPVEGVIRGDGLRLPLGHVGLEQVPPADEADNDVEQERLDATETPRGTRGPSDA